MEGEDLLVIVLDWLRMTMKFCLMLDHLTTANSPLTLCKVKRYRMSSLRAPVELYPVCFSAVFLFRVCFVGTYIVIFCGCLRWFYSSIEASFDVKASYLRCSLRQESSLDNRIQIGGLEGHPWIYPEILMNLSSL